MLRALVLQTCLLLIIASPALAEGPVRGPSAGATWDANTEPDLEGYRVYFGATPTTMSYVFEVVAPGLSYGGLGLTPGQWYVSVSAYDLSGNESEKAGPLPFMYDPVAPVSPGRFTLTNTTRKLSDICALLDIPVTNCHVDIRMTIQSDVLGVLTHP